eukprot:COSAG01_NODE_5197_length_4417_cov_5.847383_7_plen_51_part_01
MASRPDPTLDRDRHEPTIYYEGTILLDIRGKHKRGANVQRMGKALLSSWTL